MAGFNFERDIAPLDVIDTQYTNLYNLYDGMYFDTFNQDSTFYSIMDHALRDIINQTKCSEKNIKDQRAQWKSDLISITDFNCAIYDIRIANFVTQMSNFVSVLRCYATSHRLKVTFNFDPTYYSFPGYAWEKMNKAPLYVVGAEKTPLPKPVPPSMLKPVPSMPKPVPSMAKPTPPAPKLVLSKPDSKCDYIKRVFELIKEVQPKIRDGNPRFITIYRRKATEAYEYKEGFPARIGDVRSVILVFNDDDIQNYISQAHFYLKWYDTYIVANHPNTVYSLSNAFEAAKAATRSMNPGPAEISQQIYQYACPIPVAFK